MKTIAVMNQKGGTGKTTSLRGVLALFETLGLETALAALGGNIRRETGP